MPNNAPAYSEFRSYPVTSGLCSAAAVVSILYWSRVLNVDTFVFDIRASEGQIWRFFSASLPHADPLHLLFNLYWTWRFGTRIERNFGPWPYVALLGVTEIGSSVAEYAFLRGGVGLSGIGYGLFGFLWLLGRKDFRYKDAVDRGTMLLFTVWFFICIALTVTNLLPVANVAHGVGWLLGMLCAMVAHNWGRRRILWATQTGAVVAGLVVAAVFFRACVNVGGWAGTDAAYIGTNLLIENQYERSAQRLRQAVEINPMQPDAWYNLSLALERLDRTEEAFEAFKTSYNLRPDASRRARLAEMKASRARALYSSGRREDAVTLFRESLELDGSNAVRWYTLAIFLNGMDRQKEALYAIEKAATLD